VIRRDRSLPHQGLCLRIRAVILKDLADPDRRRPCEGTLN
jgi:hypothetical protein